MGMRKGQKQYGSFYTEEIWRLHYIDGKTLRQTAELLGTNQKSVVNAITREHSRRKNFEQGQPIKSRGRPRLNPETALKTTSREQKITNAGRLTKKMPRGVKEVKLHKAQYRAIYALSRKYSIFSMCKYLNMPRCSYYKWLKTTKCNSRDESIAACIQEIQYKTKQTYGYRRMQIALLKQQGLVMNHKAVYRIMAKYNLLSVIRRKYIYKGSHAIHKYANLFQRNFKPQAINQKWCTDISYILTAQGRLYLSVIKDCYDSSVIAYKYSTSMSMNLVTQTIKQAVAKEKVASGLALHSDQGFQYTSNEYYSLTKEYHITPSMSRAGTPIDNAPIESFFGSLKSECIYLEKLKTLQQAKDLIDEYIDFYNNDRIQLKIKMTPLELRKFSLSDI